MKKTEQGVSLWLFMILAPVLIALLILIIEGGMMLVNRTQAQTAADASSLAGAIALCYGEAAYPEAIKYAELNGATLEDFWIDDQGWIWVIARIDQPAILGRYFGRISYPVRARAAAVNDDPSDCSLTRLTE